MVSDTQSNLESPDELRLLEMSLNKNDIMCKFTSTYINCSGQIQTRGVEAEETLRCCAIHDGKDRSAREECNDQLEAKNGGDRTVP